MATTPETAGDATPITPKSDAPNASNGKGQDGKERESLLSRLIPDHIENLVKVLRHVDLGEVFGALGKMEPRQLQQLLKMLKSGNRRRPTPTVNGDFYHLERLLTPGEQETLLQVRLFLDEHVQPYANQWWERAEFPMDLIPKMAELNIVGMGYEGYGCGGRSMLLEGIVGMEIARVDVSICTFFGVHSGLAMGSIYHCGSEDQKQHWLPRMQRMEIIGAFGLTEPEVGSGAAGGLKTRARWDEARQRWILNGQKKWIGNATFSDVTVIWATDEADGNVKGFLVEKGTPGFDPQKIEGKMALRTVQNALITLTDCEVPESHRLQEAHNFKDTAEVLRMTRAGVAWQAVGCARGAYELALEYANTRQQFGKTIGSFQLIQDLLVSMLANLTAMQTMVFRLSQLQDDGVMTDEQASLAKVACTQHMRQIVSDARAVFGGNGILLEHNIARFMADAEALYSYEGTKEINTLIVGRAITGQSAFV